MLSFQIESPSKISPRETILQMLRGFQITQCIYAAAKLGIADLLEDSPKHCDELSTATDTHSDSLYRLLRALASIGVFAETQPKYFQLTPPATYLQENQPGSVRNFIITEVEEMYACWGGLIHSLHTGKSAFETMHGLHIEEYHKQNPAQNETFDRAMTDITAIQTPAILAAYDFSHIEKIADIGGGQGGFIAAILQHYPTLKCILFEQPYSVERARNLLTREGVIERCELVSGDFFESVTAGADTYLLKKVLLNWDDQKAIQILKSCHQAMTRGVKLLVIDRVLEKTRWKDNLADMDLWMIDSGRIRTKEEYSLLLETAGFQVTKIIPTQSLESVIEAVPF